MSETGDNEHDYNSEHLDQICDPCFEFRQQWTQTAGELGAWKGAVALLNNTAARHFIDDRTELAGELKRIAKQFTTEHVEPLSKKLDGFISGVLRT